MKKIFTLDNLTSLLFYFSILIFLIGFNFTDTPPPFGWYQQFMPFLNNQPLNDITFIDSLNGWAVTRINTTNDSGYILKTTDAGDNWTITFKNRNNFKRVVFINSSIGFTCGIAQGSGGGAFLYKSTNAGDNWFAISVPGLPNCNDMYVLNEDTIWIVENGISGNIYITTNAGSNWNSQISLLGNSIRKIYMFDRNIGFACTDFELFKTWNSGLNWTQISGTSNSSPFSDMYFVDSLTGWKTYDSVRYTTNGGYNWITQILPYGNNFVYVQMLKFSNVNKDTIWGVGGNCIFGSHVRGIIYKTTNGGNDWGYQVPDTGFNIYNFYNIDFYNKLNGWAYSTSTGVHTVTGGNDTTYSGIRRISSQIPHDYKLYQNYPNPFNPKTKINYEIKKSKEQIANIKLIVYDITGKEVAILVNQKQTAGIYETEFNGSNYSSGVYFYTLFANGIIIDNKKMVLIK